MNDNRPLEFVITKRDKLDGHEIKFFYEDGTFCEIITFNEIPSGLELNIHYFIGDLYGYQVEPMRVEDEIKKESEN